MNEGQTRICDLGSWVENVTTALSAITYLLMVTASGVDVSNTWTRNIHHLTPEFYQDVAPSAKKKLDDFLFFAVLPSFDMSMPQ